MSDKCPVCGGDLRATYVWGRSGTGYIHEYECSSCEYTSQVAYATEADIDENDDDTED